MLILFFFLAGLPAFASTAAKKTPDEAKLTITINDYKEDVSPEIYANWSSRKASLNFDLNYQAEIENPNFCQVKDYLFCQFLFSQKSKSHFKKNNLIVFNQEAAKKFLEDLARRTNSEPIDAKFGVVNGNAVNFTPEKNGSALNVEKSLPLLQAFVEKTNTVNSNENLSLPYDEKVPAVTAGEINNMGIKTLIGKGVSNFKGSTVNRIRNIKVASSRFDGVLIKPGEEFSFVKTLGDVDEKNGYFPELVIKNGSTEPEFGGGVCQVSTTAFRAAINSGLKITARRNHAYPVSYYDPQGMDSTVYVPQPDLRFKNNTPAYILIQVSIVGTEITFNFYGTDDGRKTTVEGPIILEKKPDGALKTTFTQLVADKNGNEIIKDVFNSSYASPYKYPHPGGPVLSVKPSNWSEEEWKAYQITIKNMNKAAAEATKTKTKR